MSPTFNTGLPPDIPLTKTDHDKAVREARDYVLDATREACFHVPSCALPLIDRFEAAIRAQERAEAHVAGCRCHVGDGERGCSVCFPDYCHDTTDRRCQKRRIKEER